MHLLCGFLYQRLNFLALRILSSDGVNNRHDLRDFLLQVTHPVSALLCVDSIEASLNDILDLVKAFHDSVLAGLTVFGKEFVNLAYEESVSLCLSWNHVAKLRPDSLLSRFVVAK